LCWYPACSTRSKTLASNALTLLVRGIIPEHDCLAPLEMGAAAVYGPDSLTSTVVGLTLKELTTQRRNRSAH